MHRFVLPELLRPTRLLATALVAGSTLFAATACSAQSAEPARADSAVVGPDEQAAVVSGLIDVLEARYVFPEIALEIADTLRSRLAAGAFDRPLSPDTFAVRLSALMRDISRDGHLWVTVSEDPIPPPRGAPTPEELEERRQHHARSNFGFRSVRMLPGNVGYLDVAQFVAPELAGDAAAAAMRFLSNSDAVIVDLRRSGGGSSDMVILLASYFLGPEPVHLFDRHLRPEDRTEKHWTLGALPGPTLERQPLYLLTHGRTFSAPEGLAYFLKHLDRATVVGERTGGGANPGALHRIGDRFAAFVAEARITGTVTGGNWEGKGVSPHVEVAGEDALAAAHRLAVAALIEREEDEGRRAQLREVLEEVAGPTMSAVRITEFGGPEVLRVETVPRPTPGPGELLVRVHAAGVNPVDTQARGFGDRSVARVRLPYVPGFDLSGVVAEVGDGVVRFAPGDEVFAMLHLTRGGAYAEYAIVRESEAAAKPASVSHAEAASLPLVALTVWQAFFETADLQPGHTVLIHAGAGGVGSIAIQMAKWRGATVIATASERNHEFMRSLGADIVIDYTTQRFEEVARNVDVVLDPIGGDTQVRSLGTLRDGGVLVGLLGLTPEARSPDRAVRATAILVEPSSEQLSRIGELVDRGHLRPIVSHLLPLERAPDAHRQSETRRTRGKIVLEVP